MPFWQFYQKSADWLDWPALLVQPSISAHRKWQEMVVSASTNQVWTKITIGSYAHVFCHSESDTSSVLRVRILQSSFLTSLTLFLPGEGGISPLIVCHVTKSVRNRVKFTTAIKFLHAMTSFLLSNIETRISKWWNECKSSFARLWIFTWRSSCV